MNCPSCKSKNIQIVTPAIHVGWLMDQEDIEDLPAEFNLDENKYQAYNSNESWRTIETLPPQFECYECQACWPVDKDIQWDWIA